MSCDEYLPGVAETINALVLEEAEEFLDYSFHSPCILVSMHSGCTLVSLINGHGR